MGNCFSSKPTASAHAPSAARPASTRAAKSNDAATSAAPASHTANGSSSHAPLTAAVSKKERRSFKLLLLGSGESGKSTISKQMKIIHKDGFNHAELLYYRLIIAKNLLESAQTIAMALVKYELQPEDTAARLAIQKVLNFTIKSGDGTESSGPDSAKAEAQTDAEAEGDEPPSEPPLPPSSQANPPGSEEANPLPPEMGTYAQQIWNAPQTRTLLDLHGDQFYLMDSGPYFFEQATRIAAPNYLPTNDDVLRARSKSTAITETTFTMGNLLIHLFDVGGQRSERFKWIHCFEAVTSIIFCVAISEYDQVLLEEPTQNRMDESLVLFESVVNSRWFARSSVILFLNKVDVFQHKIRRVPLEKFFPEYTGGPDVQKAARYVLWRFTQLNRAKLPIYPHLTQATDTKDIEQVFMDIKDTIVQNALRETALL